MICTNLTEYETYLRVLERSRNTTQKYLRDLRAFFLFLGNGNLCKEMIISWKEHLSESYAPASINSMLAAINSYLEWAELPQMKVKPLKIQREIFARPEKELNRDEYDRMVRAAEEKQNHRLSLLLQTICATGIRVSELKFITFEAMQIGRTTVDCKGKTRTVFLPKELCRSLQHYHHTHLYNGKWHGAHSPIGPYGSCISKKVATIFADAVSDRTTTESCICKFPCTNEDKIEECPICAEDYTTCNNFSALIVPHLIPKIWIVTLMTVPLQVTVVGLLLWGARQMLNCV